MDSNNDFEQRVAARLTELASSRTLLEACEIVAHELCGWEMQDEGWVQTNHDVPVHRMYEVAATLAKTEEQLQSLRMEALFIERSASLKAAVLALETRKRSENGTGKNGKLGGAKAQVTDAQFKYIVAQWDRDHPTTRHGLKKWASSKSGLSAEQTGKRIEALIARGEI